MQPTVKSTEKILSSSTEAVPKSIRSDSSTKLPTTSSSLFIQKPNSSIEAFRSNENAHTLTDNHSDKESISVSHNNNLPPNKEEVFENFWGWIGGNTIYDAIYESHIGNGDEDFYDDSYDYP